MKSCSDDNWNIELNIEIVSIIYFYYIFYLRMNLVFYDSTFKRL